MLLILTLVALAWLLLSGMVAVLCLAAQGGDAALPPSEPKRLIGCAPVVRRRPSPQRQRVRR